MFLFFSATAFSETVDSQSYSVTAEVGLLTRNVKVIGEDYANLFDESFGARILVGLAADAEQSYLGTKLFLIPPQRTTCCSLTHFLFVHLTFALK